MEDIVLIDGKKYYVLTKINYEGNDYIYVSLMDNDDISDSFSIFKCLNDKYEIISDSSLIKVLLPIIIKNLDEGELV